MLTCCLALGTWLRGCTSFPNNQESDTGMLMVTESFPRFQQNAYADSEVLPVRPRTGFAHPQPSIPPTHPDQGWAMCEQATPSPLESDTERSLFQKTSVQAFLWKGGGCPSPGRSFNAMFSSSPPSPPLPTPFPVREASASASAASRLLRLGARAAGCCTPPRRAGAGSPG